MYGAVSVIKHFRKESQFINVFQGTLDAASVKQVQDHLSSNNLFHFKITIAIEEAGSGFSFKKLF